MKNEAIAVHGSDALPAPWRDALALLDRDLLRRGTAERHARGVRPRRRGARPLGGRATRSSPPTSTTRGCAATPPSSPSAASRRARSPASSRRCAPASACSSSTASRRPTRPTCSPRPSSRSGCRARSSPPTSALLLDRIPASTPLELRDRALFELAYACGLRAEELVDLDVGSIDFDAEQVRVEGKGGKTRFVPAGEHALRAVRALPGARARRARRGRRGSPRCSSPRPAGGSPRPTSGAVCGPGRGPPRRRARCIRTPSGIRSRLIFWRAVPISEPSRRCSATRPYRPPRSTLG